MSKKEKTKSSKSFMESIQEQQKTLTEEWGKTLDNALKIEKELYGNQKAEAFSQNLEAADKIKAQLAGTYKIIIEHYDKLDEQKTNDKKQTQGK